jgi:hypothetical protein
MGKSINCDCGHESDQPEFCKGCEKLMCPACYKEHVVEVAVGPDGKPIQAELFEAFAWFCPGCGHMNTMKMVKEDPNTAVLDEREEQNFRESLGLEPWESIPDDLPGNLVHIPYEVTCSHCRGVFAAKPPLDGTNLDEDSDDELSDDEFEI